MYRGEYLRIPIAVNLRRSILHSIIFFPTVCAIFIILCWYFQSGNLIFSVCWSTKTCRICSRHNDSNISKHKKQATVININFFKQNLGFQMISRLFFGLFITLIADWVLVFLGGQHYRITGLTRPEFSNCFPFL